MAYNVSGDHFLYDEVPINNELLGRRECAIAVIAPVHLSFDVT